MRYSTSFDARVTAWNCERTERMAIFADIILWTIAEYVLLAYLIELGIVGHSWRKWWFWTGGLLLLLVDKQFLWVTGRLASG